MRKLVDKSVIEDDSDEENMEEFVMTGQWMLAAKQKASDHNVSKVVESMIIFK